MKKLLLSAVLVCALLPAAARADGILPDGSIALEGLRTLGFAHGAETNVYRVETLTPRLQPRITVVEQIAKRDARIARWWSLPGEWGIPAVAFDPTAPGGLAADGRTLVLTTLPHSYPPPQTHLAILDTGRTVRGRNSTRHTLRHLTLPGAYSLDASSPRGSRLYLTHWLYDGIQVSGYEMRALDTATGRLSPRPVAGSEGQGEPHQGTAITRLRTSDGRWVYTLYGTDTPFLEALDTVRGRVAYVDLPQLPGDRTVFDLRLRFGAGDKRIEIFGPEGTSAAVDTASFRFARRASTAPLFKAVLTTLALLAPRDKPSAARPADDLLAFAETPRHPARYPMANVLLREGVAGHSEEGRKIRLKQLGDPALPGRLLVFGCIHGDECAAQKLALVTGAGCPDPGSNIFFVPNLDPDGFAAGTRLNGSGVDLNRNFPAQWRSSGTPGEPEYSGAHPFSEPEARLAAQIVRELQPRATVWFHQHRGPHAFVRAWGQSAPDARYLARRAGISFRLMRWQDGTAPNWQNHRFRGSSSFVVELPPGPLAPSLYARLDKALVQLGRKVSQD